MIASFVKWLANNRVRVAGCGLTVFAALMLFGWLSALYLAAATSAAWAVWPDHNWRNVGLALLVSWFVSNLISAGPDEYVAALYSMTEVVILLMAFGAWCDHPSRAWCDHPSRAARLLALTAFISIGFNLIYAGSDHGDWARWRHQWATNGTFAVECFITALTGVLQRGHINISRVGRRRNPNRHVHVQEGADQWK